MSRIRILLGVQFAMLLSLFFLWHQPVVLAGASSMNRYLLRGAGARGHVGGIWDALGARSVVPGLRGDLEGQFGSPGGQVGPPAAEDCAGVDLLLIIDQSGSMSGVGDVPGNDPQARRIEAAHQVIEQLGANRIQFCPSAVHRLAVIGFGDGDTLEQKTRVELEFTEFGFDPKDKLGWERIRAALKAKIEARRMGYTDFASAFTRAKALFGPLGPVAGDTKVRKQAIILLTDGGACVANLGCQDGQDGMDRPKYLREMRDQIDTNFPFTPGRGMYLWVVSMQDQGEDYLAKPGSTSGETVEQYWQNLAASHGGKLFRLSKNREDVPATFFQILLTSGLVETGNVKPVPCGTHYIEPYSESVTFTFFKNSSAINVSIQHTMADKRELIFIDGQATLPDFVRDENYSYTPGGNVENYVIQRPELGAWTLTAPGCEEQVRIYSNTITPTIRLSSPISMRLYDTPPFYDENDKHFLAYEVQARSTGEPFPEVPAHPLDVRVTITSPSGQKIQQTLQRVGGGALSGV